MPLTTPQTAHEQYSGDPDHFLHVLDHLFAPAVDAAGYELIRPSARGGDLIHAEIIKNLEQAELVLCDVSQLNANVFFELGIRTALDRPVAMVKDDKTATYPFDTAMINYHSYDSSLAAWTLQAQVDALTQHLKDSADGAHGRNSMWRYFGLTQRAEPADITNPVEAKLDLLVEEIEKLRGSRVEFDDSIRNRAAADILSQLRRFSLGDNPRIRVALGKAAAIADETGVRLKLRALSSSWARVEADGALSPSQRMRIAGVGVENGVDIEIHEPGSEPG